MSAEADIHVALMARAEVMATALSYPVLWPQKGGDIPTGEHIAVFQLPNDNQPSDLSSDVMRRQGFLVITLVSPLGVYEAVTKQKAGAIAGYFPRALRLTANTTTVTINSHSVRTGRQEGQRWETPIFVSYQTTA
jgi:hypothetical protein